MSNFNDDLFTETGEKPKKKNKQMNKQMNNADMLKALAFINMLIKSDNSKNDDFSELADGDDWERLGNQLMEVVNGLQAAGFTRSEAVMLTDTMLETIGSTVPSK